MARNSEEKLKAITNINIHYLHNHLDRIPDNLSSYNEEQGRGHIMVNYCWTLQRDCPGQNTIENHM